MRGEGEEEELGRGKEVLSFFFFKLPDLECHRGRVLAHGNESGANGSAAAPLCISPD